VPPVYHFRGWFVGSGCAWLEQGGCSRAEAPWSGAGPRRAGVTELDQVPAEIPFRVKRFEGNDLFVRREQGWRGAVLGCLLPPCRGCRRRRGEPWPRPAGYRGREGGDGRDGERLCSDCRGPRDVASSRSLPGSVMAL